ncbi:hypothetical protein ACGFU4_36280 [Streptomyces sp. NPDC048511]|uniref:hypothetical protein n=1 Tax=Streptomyces sp. NPDC048511 TaxID=3365562 RepID=UPI003724988D
MVAVLSAVAVCLLVASPFGVALYRHLTGRMPAPPEPYVRHRPAQHPAVILAELEVRQTYPHIAALYEVPTQSEPAHQ